MENIEELTFFNSEGSYAPINSMFQHYLGQPKEIWLSFATRGWVIRTLSE